MYQIPAAQHDSINYNHQRQRNNPWAQGALQIWQTFWETGNHGPPKNRSQLWSANESAKFFSNRLCTRIL